MADEVPLRQLLSDRIDASGKSPGAMALLRGMLPEAATAEPGRVGPVRLRSITAAGWRGIGPETTLELPPGPGLTVVVGGNGTGKSSFAEAAEIALTGANTRWDRSNGKSRTTVWQKGWRNLHAPTAPSVSLCLTLDDTGAPATVRRTWYGEEVHEARTAVVGADGTERPLEEYLDATTLSHHRPFLPYSELGSMVDGTMSALHDSLARFVGLGQLADIDERLAARVKEYKTIEKAPAPLRERALRALSGLDDQRAVVAARALDGKSPDVEAVRTLLAEDDATDQGEEARLRTLAALSGPDGAEVAGALLRLRKAATAADAVRHSDAAGAQRLASLLADALEHRRHTTSPDCPVCHAPGRLDQTWAEATRSEIGRLQAEAAEAETARRDLDAARRAVHDLVQPVPGALRDEDSELADLWRAWALCRNLTDPSDLGNEVERIAPALNAACRQLSAEARRRLADRDTAWRPAALELAQWLDATEAAAKATAPRKEAEEARTWLRKVTTELREERMAGFVQESQDVWRKLCESSSVTLGNIKLTGTARQGRVNLDVSVDNHEAPAYSVMSQGELHSLALSLFIPRAKHPTSPFGFLLIDDPVQSMDPPKVEGLAGVLHDCARDRQVIVFTHDTRLTQAIHHLGIPATILHVTRESGSVVTVERQSDPVQQALQAARDLSLDRHLPPQVAARTIPAMCRTALEAACVETAHRTLREHHELGLAEIEARLAKPTRTKEFVALALHGDSSADARSTLESLHAGGWALVNELNAASHPDLSTADDGKRLVRRTERLAGAIRRGRGSVGPRGGAR